MEASGTSLEIMVLLTIAAAVVLYAWWLSIAESRRRRDLAAWLRQHHGERWDRLPWLSRNLITVHAIELLRRGGLAEDPDFMTRYRAMKSGKGRQLALLALTMVLIGAVGLGVRYLGWTW